MTAYAYQAGGVIRLHVGATVMVGEVGDVITRDATAAAFTVTCALCNACTASPSGYID